MSLGNLLCLVPAGGESVRLYVPMRPSTFPFVPNVSAGYRALQLNGNRVSLASYLK